jgi:anaerobic selenocysteine-containing dehydrogenase
VTVTVEDGRIARIDGGLRNEVTRGYICSKVRRFGERVHGDLRLTEPLLRAGPKGAGVFKPVSWDTALETVAQELARARDRWGGESILPFCYGGSNGPFTQNAGDAWLFERLGASRLLRTACAATNGAAHSALYGKMPGVSYLDYPHAKLIVLWGVNPSASGIHLVPFINEAREAGARLVVIDPRSTPLARRADLHLSLRPGTDLPLALAVHRFLFDEGLADKTFLAEHATGAPLLEERARRWTASEAAAACGLEATDILAFAEMYATAQPAVIRCGWGMERNRNGGNAAMAILALPAVAGKFGVRGGGFSMSCSSAWDLGTSRWMPASEPGRRSINMSRLGRALTETDDPPVKVLFVYNCNPVVTMPDSNRVLAGLAREDLFTVVFEQVATDTVAWADVVLPATTFLEHLDLAKSYGVYSLQAVVPAVARVGQARPNHDVFAELAARLGLMREGEPMTERALAEAFLAHMQPSMSEGLRANGRAEYPGGPAPVLFVDVFPRTPGQKVRLFDEEADREAPLGLYRYQPEPASAFPLALISPANEWAISSTLYELVDRQARVQVHPDDAAARGIEDRQTVRIWNELGEVVCDVEVSSSVRPGVVSLPKGLWRKHTRNGGTANSLIPDHVSDLGGGACYNDARVEMERYSEGRSA